MTLEIKSNADGTSDLSFAGEPNKSFQLYDWNESDRIAARILDTLSEELRRTTPSD